MRLGSIVRTKVGLLLISALMLGLGTCGTTNPVFARANPFTTVTSPLSDSTQRLQDAVHRLNAWLNGSGQRQQWRKFLMLNVLETQSAMGEQADIATLSQVHNRFCGGASGLELPAFQQVRVALEQQIQQLSGSQVGDLATALVMARAQYRPISVSDMAFQRDQAKQALHSLKGYYRETIPSRDRALLFSELQLEEAIAHLDQINFELAPEISVGKMTSMIQGVEKQLDEVVKQIDALPFEPEPNNQDQKLDQPDNAQDPKRPVPDEGKPTRQDLQKEQTKLKARIEELKQQRLDISRADTPRRTARQEAFAKLREIDNNFAELGETQGDPFFVSAAHDYGRFVRSYFYGTSDNLQEDFLKRLGELEADLLQINGPESREFVGKVGDHLRWMENANQIPYLVTAIRARHSHPNVYVSVGSSLLNRLASKPLDESRCLNENIDGRQVKGTLRSTGQVTIDLQNDPNQVHASIHLLGGLSTSTYIDQGRIRAFASTTGQLEARRSIYANIGGLFANEPYVAANIQAAFNGTSSRLRLINKFATKKFGEVKIRTEGISARKAEDELYEKFAEQTNEAVQKGQEALHDAQDKIISNSQLIPEIYLRSFNSEIMAIGKKSSISTLAAQTKPATLAVPINVAVRVHDSMPSNFLENIFSGKTYTNEELAEELGSIVGETPETLKDKPDGKDESFSITFATIRPIQIEFEDNGLRVVVSGRRFAQGDRRINEGLKIILRFKIMRVDGKLKFVRDGKAIIDYLPDAVKRPATVAFRSFLDGKLNPAEGGEELSADLPDNLIPVEELLEDSELEGKIIRGMRLVQCRAENGWLYIGWNYQEGDGYTNWIHDTPAIWNTTIINQMLPANGDGSAPIEGLITDPVVVPQQ